MDEPALPAGTEPGASSFASLAGQTAVVTGASSGIGRAIALELARAGADLVVHAGTNRQGADESADMIRSMGRQVIIRMADLAEADSREKLVREAWSWREGVDIWINNAGADVLTGDPAGWGFAAKLERLWRVDVQGTIFLSRLVGNRMRASRPAPGSSALLNIGWDQAEIGMAGDSGEMFAATKGAIMAFTRSLARSLAPAVRVNCLAPGWIRTAWGDQASDYWQQRAVRESLLERWGEPGDVARMARYLVSPEASFITGQIVAVNGGNRA
jgi:3-oxoacyl-[acyl-carrier protein] reductase